MVDFKKLLDRLKEKDAQPQKDYEYRCSRCGEDVVYVQKMPDHLLKHHSRRDGRRCGGTLVIRRAIPREVPGTAADRASDDDR